MFLQIILESIFCACGQMCVEEVEDFKIPPCLVSCDNAPLPSAPSVAVLRREEGKNDADIYLTGSLWYWSPEHGAPSSGSAVEHSVECSSLSALRSPDLDGRTQLAPQCMCVRKQLS